MKIKDETVKEMVETLQLCYLALKDHVQYEEGEISLEGEAFRSVVNVLNEIASGLDKAV